MKALQDKCINEKGVISRLRKRNKTLTNEQDQYKDALLYSQQVGDEVIWEAKERDPSAREGARGEGILGKGADGSPRVSGDGQGKRRDRV